MAGPGLRRRLGSLREAPLRPSLQRRFPLSLQAAAAGALAAGAARRGRERCLRRRLGLKQDGGAGRRVLQCGQPSVVPDMPGATAARRGGGI